MQQKFGSNNDFSHPESVHINRQVSNGSRDSVREVRRRVVTNTYYKPTISPHRVRVELCYIFNGDEFGRMHAILTLDSFAEPDFVLRF